MSTRCTIKYSRPEDGPGFHLFEDAWLSGPDDPVELELFGVEAEVSTNGFARIVIPRAMARELGLMPTAEAAPPVRRKDDGWQDVPLDPRAYQVKDK